LKGLADRSLYEVLEVQPGAPTAEIERAWARAKALYGPGSLVAYTLVAPEEASLLQQMLDEAKAVLCDPVARAAYDNRIGVQVQPEPEIIVPQRKPEPALVPPPGSGPAPGPAPLPVATVPVSKPAPQLVVGAPPPPAPVAVGAPVTIHAPPPAIVANGVHTLAEPVRAEPAPQPVAAPVIPESAVWTGALLRQVRESRGLTVRQMADRTRISRAHLENLEGDRYLSLPAPVYLRGILTSYAKELRLDSQRVVRSYLEAAARAASESPKGR
jgi:hypothetical protein